MPYVGKSPADIIATAVDTTTGTFSGDLTVDTNTLFVDSANNRVGVGTASPDVPLEISVEGSSITNVLKLTTTGSGTVPALQFEGDASGTQHIVGRIRGQQDDANDGGLVFETESSGTVAERMRIDSSGNLLVGKTSTGLSNVGFQVLPSGVVGITRSGSNPLDLNRLSSDGNLIEFNKDGSTVGSIANSGTTIAIGNNSNAGIRFASSRFNPTSGGATDSDNAMDIGNTGARFKDLYLSGGAYLGGTGSANKLDDYEEGTWSATLSQGTCTTAHASYTKIGKRVHVSAQLRTFSNRSSTDSVEIRNLPFARDTSKDEVAGGPAMWSYVDIANTVSFLATGGLQFYGSQSGGFASLRYADLNNSSSTVYFVATYFST